MNNPTERRRACLRRAGERRRRLGFENLEDRHLLAVTFQFDYVEGNTIGFNDPIQGNTYRAALESAAARLGDSLLHDATIQLEVVSRDFDVGDEWAEAESAAPSIAPSGGFFPGVVPAKILGQGDTNGAASDGLLQVSFFDASDGLRYETNPASVNLNNEVDFQAIMTRALVHAIGFSSATNFDGSDDNGNGILSPGTWSLLDQYLTDANGNRLINPNNYRMKMGSDGWPTHVNGGPGPSNGLFFNGPIASSVYGGPVPLYSPHALTTQSVYLNNQNITISLGASMDPEPFANRTTEESLANIIDAPSADASEDHTQTTHVWVSGGDLEVDINFGQSYDVSMVHFWNYTSESFDVDDIDFTFYGAGGTVVGQLHNVMPELGGTNGFNPIFAQDFPVSISGAQRVNVKLSGSNNQVDFQNIGFTAFGDVPTGDFSVPHLDSEGYPGTASLFTPRSHLLSQATAGNAVPQELTLLEKAILADIGILMREDVRPTLSVPQSVTIEGDTTGGLSSGNQKLLDFYDTFVVSDLLDPNPVVTVNTPQVLPVGSNGVIVTATDASNNVTHRSTFINVLDTTPPEITVTSPQVFEATGPTGVDGVNLGVQVSDIVDSAPTLDVAPPTSFSLGTTLVSLTGRDASDNTSTTDVTVLVQDTTAPTLSLATDLTIDGNTATGADLSNQALIELINASSSDLVDPSLSISASPSTFPFGTTAVTFTVTDDSGNSASAASNVTVRGTTEVSWNEPATIVFGTPLGATQLNASANTTGTFSYQPAAGTVLDAGADQTLSVTFTPSNLAAYDPVTITVAIDVLQANPQITWSDPTAIRFGTALGSTQLDATANVAGTFSYSPDAGTVLNAGDDQVLQTTFTPDSSNYRSASASVMLDVLKAQPQITWPEPAAIDVGTPLGSEQLNATANVAGTFSYNPDAGTVLGEGDDQTLQVTFTPDSSNYETATSSVLIDVLPTADPVVQITVAGPGGATDPADLPRGPQPTSWAQQRSMMRQIVVDLDISIGPLSVNNFVLTNLGVNAPVDPDTVIALRQDQLSQSNGFKRLVFEFDAGQLSDGVYQLELKSPLTGATLYTITGNATNKLYILEGDWNGSGGVNIQDFATFAYWMGKPVPEAPHYVDANNSGGINIQDFAAFAANFGKQVTFPTPSALIASGAAEGESIDTAEPKQIQQRLDSSTRDGQTEAPVLDPMLTTSTKSVCRPSIPASESALPTSVSVESKSTDDEAERQRAVDQLLTSPDWFDSSVI